MERRFVILFLCCMGAVAGIMVCLWKWKTGLGMILFFLLVQMIYLAMLGMKTRKVKTCPRCRTVVEKGMRMCSECGFIFHGNKTEPELLAMTELESMPSDEIDCNFEKMEQIAMDEVEAFGGDIEALLRQRESEDMGDAEKYM